MPTKVNTSALTIGNTGNNKNKDDRPIAIKVDHVSMVFNMASEQLNSLKEYAIKLAKRELFFKGFKALDDISFEVKKGDVFGILGTNGSGKSTMMKLIAGVMEPTKGTCEVNGTIAPLIELGAGFDHDLSARENIYLNGALLGYSKQFIDDHFDEIVDFAEIKDFLDMPLKNYSSGMVARIAFAIATVIVPDILLVDEVLSVGDFMFQKKCEDRINKLIEEHNVTVLIVSHSNEQIARMCNKAIWIEKGHTRLIGDAKTVCNIYGGLGGRIGSPEAEQRVFQAIKDSMQLREEDIATVENIIAGENHYSINVKLIRQAWDFSEIDSVVFACDNTHVNAIAANSIAAAINAPVLPISFETIPESIEHFLQIAQPRNIILCSCDCDPTKTLNDLSSLSWNPNVRSLSAKASHFEFSYEAIREASRLSNENLSSTIALIDFDDNSEAFAIAPYLYAHKIPSLVLDGDSISPERLHESIQELNGAAILVVGNKATKWWMDSSLSTKITNQTVTSFNESSDCIDITLFVEKHRNSDNGTTILLAPLSIGQWPELISSGCIAEKLNSSILFVDQTNLENIASGLDLIKDQKPSKLIFIESQNGLTEADRKLFSSELIAQND